LGSDAEGIDQSIDLSLAVLDRLARLDAQRVGELVEPLGEASNTMIEHRLALVARHARHRFCRLDRARDRRIDRRDIGPRYAERDLAGEFVGHCEIGVRLLRHIIEIERIDGLENGHWKLLGYIPPPGKGWGTGRRSQLFRELLDV